MTPGYHNSMGAKYSSLTIPFLKNKGHAIQKRSNHFVSGLRMNKSKQVTLAAPATLSNTNK